MTRINVGIPPAELNGKHLIAEHREIKRIPNLVNRGRYSLDNQPKLFKLGTGHVKFFYDKLLYLKQRYDKLYNECKKRGFKVQNYSSAWKGSPKHLMNDYTPTERDRDIIRQRIKEKLNKNKKQIDMKKLILALLLAPLLLLSQTVESLNGIAPDFTVTDIQGNEHNLYSYLDEGNIVVIQFHSTSATCWPSYDSVSHITEAYYNYGCNEVVFINIAWNGNIFNTNYYADLYGDPNIPFVTAENGGSYISLDVYPVQIAYECWLIRPDRSFIHQIPNWDQGVLGGVLEDEGLTSCPDTWDPEGTNSINIEEYYLENNDKTIYDLQGRILNEVPKNGFYVQGGKKYIIIK